MKISKKAYYGLRASLALLETKKPLSIHVLAEKEGIPEDYLEKILQALRRQNLLEAERGTKGGYRIKKNNLSAWDIISTLDGPLKLYPSLIKGSLPCFQPTHCQTNTIFRELEENLELTLKNIHLTSLINQK
ncbi:MAG: Rrf2 family transcriptional regulator [Candidatus Moranbacteria bacterium]|nr:Rrf2 family transcriptional regulator [Candidatus Moranbacteria bacterium]